MLFLTSTIVKKKLKEIKMNQINKKLDKNFEKNRIKS